MPYIANSYTGQMQYYDEAWKVGMVYINLSGNNPNQEVGYGTWELIAMISVGGS